MANKSLEGKNLDGLNTGSFDALFVGDNALINGNLTVNGTISGGLGPTTDEYFVATDASNQFRAQSSTVDIVSTNSASPTFKLKNNAGVTTTSTLEVGQANVVNLGSTGISNSGTINTGTLSTGVLTSTSGTVGATTVTASGQTTTGNLLTTLDTQSTSTSTGAIVTPGGLGVAKQAHVGGQLHCTANTASSSTTTGSLRVTGGVGISGDVHAGGTLNAGTVSVTTANVSGTTTSGLLTTNLSVNGSSGITVSNQNTGSNAHTIISFDTDNANSGVIFMNGSNRTNDGGANTLVMRNDAGNLILQNNTGSGLTVTSGSVSTPSTVTAGAFSTSGTVTSAGATLGATGLTINGGDEVLKGGRLYVRQPTGNVGVEVRYDGTKGDIYSFDRDLSQYKQLNIQDTLRIAANTLQSNFITTDDSTSPTSGSVIMNGGLGVAKNIYAGAGVTALTLNSTSSVNGATVASSGNTSVGGNLTVTGTTTMNDPMVQNDPLDADDGSPGSVFTWGGLKAVKKVYAQGGLVIPYGVPIQANTVFGTTAKMMQALYEDTQDKICLYTPGVSPGSSTTPVLKVNFFQCELPQTTQATSTTTGALRVAGGVGIVGNLHVGGTITGGSVSYSSTSSGTFSVTNGSGTTLTVASTTTSTSPTTGSATFAGGVGIAGNLNVGGTITGGSISYASTSTGSLSVTNSPGTTVTISSSEDSSGTTTGAMTVIGGVGVGKGLSVGGNLLTGLVPINGVRYHALYNSSTDPAAGISVTFDTAAAGSPAEIITLGPNHATNANDMIVRNPAGNLLLYGSGNAGFYVGNSIAFCQLPFLVQNTNNAVAYNNASMVTSGGLGVGKTARIGSNVVAGDIAVDGVNSITVSNQSAGTGAYAAFTLDTQAVGNGNIFMNGPNRTADGGANTMTIRNDAGVLRLQGTAVTVPNTTASSSTTTGALQVGGGVGIVGDTIVGGLLKSESEVRVQRTGAAEMSVYNNGSTNEWLFGQRSVSDHDFTFSWKAGATIAPVARINTAGQLKLGNGDFFGYREGSWTPTIDYTSAAPTSITYAEQYGRFTVVGKTVTLTYQLRFDYGLGATGSYFLIKGIPADLALTTQTEVTQSCFRGNFAGITNPFYTTLWKNGYNLPGVAVFDGRTMTIGAYNNGGYITGAYQAFGAGGQEMWGTLTYTLA